MKNYLIDTHTHIDMLEESPEKVIQDMLSAGVKKAIIPAVDVKTLEKVCELGNNYPEFYSMVGIFPSEVKTYNSEIETKMYELAQCKKVVAVGEIGLDYYWDKSFNELQQDVFAKQIKMANELNLPIVVHDREAHKDTFDILKKENMKSKVLFHCFSASVEFMRECVKEGWNIAIGGVVTFKNAVKMKEVAVEVPLEKLMLETDSPYLTPVPYRGKPNKPAYVRYVAEEIAKLRNVDIETIINATTINAEEFFNL